MVRPQILWLLLVCWAAGCAGAPFSAAGTVRALRYSIKVSRSGLELIHGGAFWVDELFLPDYGVACDINWDAEDLRLRVFPATAARLHEARDVTEVLVARDVALQIKGLAEQQAHLAHQAIDSGLLPAERADHRPPNKTQQPTGAPSGAGG